MLGPFQPASERNTIGLYRKVAIACHNMLTVHKEFTN